MYPPEPLVGLVASARRRLWFTRLIGELALGVGVGASGAAAVWGVSRVLVFPWADLVATGLLFGALVAVLSWWVFHRPTSAQAALWADHRLGGDDRLSTAWELSRTSRPGTAELWQMAEAGRWAAEADSRSLGGDLPPKRMLVLVVLAVAAALVLAVAPSVTDKALADSREVKEAVEREKALVENLASQAPEELAEELRELSDRLDEVDTLEEALSELSSSRLALEERLGPNRLAESTALTGLASRLSQNPVGRGDDPASQLSDLASSLEGMSAAQRQAVADELAARSADFAGSNDGLSAALAEAASALAGDGSFDIGQAAAALQQAAGQISSAQKQASRAAAAAATAAQLAEAEARLRTAQQGGVGSGQSGSGEGEGSGSGQGQGQGAGSGQGQGSGSGEGEGSGQGSGGGQGGGQTNRSGMGQGSVSGVGDNDPATAPRYSSSVFEPPAGGLGEEVRVPIGATGPGEVAGSSTAPSVANAPLISYTERLAEYRSEALASLERRSLPSHLTEVVHSYFTELEP